jgi:small subunit ribosomal protein S20
MKSAIREVEKLVAEKKKNEALKLLPLAYKAIDKAEKGNTIKKNTANRKKSRLAKRVEKIA